MPFDFTKMHGLGNDFIVINALDTPFNLTATDIAVLADRRTGVGFDQLLVVEPPDGQQVDFTYRIFNADGGEVENCGNGARCFASYVTDKGLIDKKTIRVSTAGGLMELSVLAPDQVLVNMGVPQFAPADVPFVAEEIAGSYPLDVDGETLHVGVVAIGNPHAVTWIDDVKTIDIQRFGPVIEHHPRFPNRVNAGFAEVISRSEIRLRVYERGVGETQACGTGACAAVAVGIAQGILDNEVCVHLSGGDLQVKWLGKEAQIEMIGPSATVFEGRLEQ